MKNPIETKDGKTTIDNVAINSFAQRFLNGIKAFLISIITQKKWDDLGLEKTWKFFLPFLGVILCLIANLVSYYAAIAIVIITAVWLWRSRTS